VRRLTSRLKKRAETAEGLAVVVGLRNPGPDYEGTRHNVGFEVVAAVAARAGTELGRAPSRISGQAASVGNPPHRMMLITPFMFMNESGRVVRSALDYWKVAHDRLLVVHDDIDLPFGRLRLQIGGGSGGHNGIRSVERALGHRDFSRLKVGVGRPPGSMDPAAYVLQRFSKSERAEVDVMVVEAAEIVETWVHDAVRAQEMAALRGRDG
jgi:peptidyl-tRNA hydrolase, PTH1 family